MSGGFGTFTSKASSEDKVYPRNYKMTISSFHDHCDGALTLSGVLSWVNPLLNPHTYQLITNLFYS